MTTAWTYPWAAYDVYVRASDPNAVAVEQRRIAWLCRYALAIRHGSTLGAPVLFQRIDLADAEGLDKRILVWVPYDSRAFKPELRN